MVIIKVVTFSCLKLFFSSIHSSIKMHILHLVNFSIRLIVIDLCIINFLFSYSIILKCSIFFFASISLLISSQRDFQAASFFSQDFSVKWIYPRKRTHIHKLFDQLSLFCFFFLFSFNNGIWMFPKATIFHSRDLFLQMISLT